MSRLEISAEFLDALQQLSSVLETDDALDQTLDTVVKLSVATLQGCDAADITLHVNGKDMTFSAGVKGSGGSMSFPLSSDGWTGALNLYSDSENAFTDEGATVAEVFARQATIALRNAQTYAAARAVADQLNEALQTRDMIGQAKGILMEREGISDQEAFEMLRTISQNSNVKLRDIAHRLIEDKAPRD